MGLGSDKQASPHVSARRFKGTGSALMKLAADPIRYLTVIGAFFPEMVREAVLDWLAEVGMTQDDLRGLIRELEKPASLQ
jgi:hypothetical protein